MTKALTQRIGIPKHALSKDRHPEKTMKRIGITKSLIIKDRNPFDKLQTQRIESLKCR